MPDITSTAGAPPAATCSVNGIFRPDCDTIRIDGDGVLRLDIATIAHEIAEALKPAPPVQLPVVTAFTASRPDDENASTLCSCTYAPENIATDMFEAEFAGSDPTFAGIIHTATGGVIGGLIRQLFLRPDEWHALPQGTNHVRVRVVTPDGAGPWFVTTIDTTDWPYPKQATDTRHGEILHDADGNPVAVVIGSFASGGAEPWNIFGKKVWLAVATAQFRTCKMVGWYDVNIPNADETINVKPYNLASSNIGADGTGDGLYVSRLSTEAHMDAAFPNDANQDSRRKTDILLQGGHPAGYPPDAATWCRSLVPVINGVPTPMDLPRQSVVMRIYQARDIIDAIDPTAAAYSSNLLQQSTWGRFEGGSTAGVSSSSVASDNPAHYVWDVGYQGHILYHYRRYYAGGVVACLEIPAE